MFWNRDEPRATPLPPTPAARFCIMRAGEPPRWQIREPDRDGAQVGESYDSEPEARQAVEGIARQRPGGGIVVIYDVDHNYYASMVVRRFRDITPILFSYPLIGKLLALASLVAVFVGSLLVNFDTDFLLDHIDAIVIAASLLITIGFAVIAQVMMDRRTIWELQVDIVSKIIGMVLMALFTFVLALGYLFPWSPSRLIFGSFLLGAAVLTVSGTYVFAIAAFHYMRDSRVHQVVG